MSQYNPEFAYIQGEKNIVAGALSRLDIKDNQKPISSNLESMAEHFALSKNDLPEDIHPTNYKTIMKHQQKDKNLTKMSYTAIACVK